MKYEILGFNQKQVIELNLNLKDLLLLDYITDAIASPTMEHRVQDGVAYVWLKHDRILKDLPILDISERSLIDYLNKLKDLGLLNVCVIKVDSGRGSKSYYAITERCEELKYDQVQKIAVSQRPGAENCTSDNTSNISSDNTNNQQELFNTNKEVINKEDTYRDRVQDFVRNFNEICVSLPRCTRLTTKRSKGIVSILKKYSELEIREVFIKLEASDFCTGKNDRGWKADIDFILREDKFLNVLEGKYDNRVSTHSVETISKSDNKYRVSKEEKEEMRRAIERGDLEVY